MKNDVLQLASGDVAVIIKEDGQFELLVPPDLDDDSDTGKALQLILKMFEHQHLIEYVAQWEGADYIWESDKETWH